MAKQVAFLGLGAMGRPMASNLARAGFVTRAWNRTAKPFAEVAAAGVLIEPELPAAVRGAEVVCVCVLDDAAAAAVLAAALPHLAPGTVVLDHSTLGVGTAQRLAQQAAASGVDYLDAPVSGGTGGAEAGTLTIMVGGRRAAFDQVQDVLPALGRLLRYMGPSGCGQGAKLVNQLLTAVHSAAAVEALHLGARLGLDLAELQTVLAASFGASRMLDRTVPVLQQQAFASAFTVDVLSKDLGLIQTLGQETGTALPLGEAALRLYRAGQQAGLGGQDAAALVRLLAAQSSGIPAGEEE
ncbi:MAG TPA: NAD(P)-dependent oxidoreductase [Gammaproteobacteria bacterium]|nr:NAD(P)-dependent oxidoreductase [Gammaproteobacteria bacterium]